MSLGPDNLHFRKRLRRAHPETEDAMRRQRQACLEVRFLPAARKQRQHWMKTSRSLEA